MNIPFGYAQYAVSEKYLELSLEYIEQERCKEALHYLELILHDMPNHLRALYNAAVCKEQLEDFEGANAYVTEYLKEKPEDSDALQLQMRVGAATGTRTRVASLEGSHHNH